VIIDLSAANAGLPNLPSTHDDNAPAFLPEAERQTSAEKEVLICRKTASGTPKPIEKWSPADLFMSF